MRGLISLLLLAALLGGCSQKAEVSVLTLNGAGATFPLRHLLPVASATTELTG